MAIMENKFKNGKITKGQNGGFVGKFITRGGEIITVIAATVAELFRKAAAMLKVAAGIAALMACSCSRVEQLATVAVFADGTHTDTVRYESKARIGHADTLFDHKADAVFKTWKVND